MEEKEIYGVTPAQIWSRYIEIVQKDPKAYLEIPTIKSLKDIEKLSREEQIKLYYFLLENEPKRENKAQIFKQILDELKANKKHGIDYIREREKEQIKEVFKNTRFTKRYILTIKVTYRKNYYLVYANKDLTKLQYDELKELIKKVQGKYKELVKSHLSVKEFSITHKNISLVLEKFKKDELLTLTHLTLINISKILKVKEKRAKKRKVDYLISFNLKFFFENCFM